jgi:manganese oxidase
MGMNRRQLLQGAVLAGLGGGAIASCRRFWPHHGAQIANFPPMPSDFPSFGNQISSMQLLREFDYGTLKQEAGRQVREFRAIANSSPLELTSTIKFMSWNINGRVPGPTFRAKAGEWVRVIFENDDGHSHSLHFHGIHPAEMDGVKPVRKGKTFIYEFEAKPAGLHLYHCHIVPVTRHVGKGLYGLFIIDPPERREPADEMVLILGGYDINNDATNELYAFNGIPNYYRDYPIQIYQQQLVRVYLLNMIELDPAITFHIHANLFQLYRTGRSLTPDEETDVVTMGTAERHILEFRYPYPGQYMFHPHQDAIAERGCMGLFEVLARPA